MASTSGDDKSGDPQTSGELESADLFRRAKATQRLGRYADPQALDRLLALLADPDWPVVKAALGALSRYRDPRIVAAAQAVLRRDDYFRTFTRGGAIGTAATRALRSQGEEGFQALLTLLREFQDDEIRGQSVVRQLAVLRDPRAIEPLIACFESPVFEVANRAAAVMRHFGADAIPPLVAAMSTSDQSVYFQVIWALRWTGAPAVPALLDALRHATDANIRSGAADVLDGTEGEEVREALRAALEDPNEGVRRMAMWSLGNHGDLRVLDLLLAETPSPRPGSSDPASTLAQLGSAAVPLLIAALEDQTRPAYQRAKAAHALGLIEDKRAVEPLIAALRDDDEGVRVAATSALGDLKDARAVDPLLDALHDSSSKVRVQVVYELASSEADRAFDAVASFVRESGEDNQTASGVLMTLALHYGARALPLLREMALGENRRLSIVALPALGQLGAPAVPVLLELGRDPRPERRFSSINWLKMAYRHSHDPRIVEFLFEATQEKPASSVATWMRYYAALALAKCGDPRSIEPLLEILQNAASHPGMRYSAVWPLGQLGGERVLEALTAAYEASMAGEEGAEAGERPGQRYDFQDALLGAMTRIRARLGITRADADPSGASAAT